MINHHHIEEIICQQQWHRDGLDYALTSWTSTFNRMGKPNPYSRIEKIVLGIIAEKAFECYIKRNKIKYETLGKTKWYEVDRYDIGINNFAIDVKANFLDHKALHIQNRMPINTIEKQKWFLECTALVPLDQFNPGKNERRTHKRNKVYVFPFVEGYFIKPNLEAPLIHAFWDYKWLKKAEYKKLKNLGNLTIKYNGNNGNSWITLYGTSKEKVLCIEKISIKKGKQVTINDFFQLFTIEWHGDLPVGNLEIISQEVGIKEVIKPEGSFMLRKIDEVYWPEENNWQSLALFNSKVHLLGWIYEEDFRVNGREFKRYCHTIKQYSETQVDNWGCLIKELEPINTINTI